MPIRAHVKEDNGVGSFDHGPANALDEDEDMIGLGYSLGRGTDHIRKK